MKSVRTYVSAILLTPLAFLSAQAPKPGAVQAIPVAMLVDDGTFGKGPKMLEATCRKDADFRITRLSGADVRAGRLKEFRALIVPGGTAQRQSKALREEGRTAVKQFVAEGGTFVGICAGCFLASSHYDWSLHLLPVKVVDDNNWERGYARLALEIAPEGKKWLGRTKFEAKSIYHNGPVLEAEAGASGKLITLATYKEEVVQRGARSGLMLGAPAIVAARYGKGWAVGVSPHVEQTEGLKDLVPAAMRWTLEHPLGK